MDDSWFEQLVKTARAAGIERCVVGAVISQDANALLLRRVSGDFLEGLYELPSGKVEEGEALPDALRREIFEETNTSLDKIVKYIGMFDYYSGSGKKTRQFNFLVAIKQPAVIRLCEHDDYVWATEAEIGKYRVSPEVAGVIKSAFS